MKTQKPNVFQNKISDHDCDSCIQMPLMELPSFDPTDMQSGESLCQHKASKDNNGISYQWMTEDVLQAVHLPLWFHRSRDNKIQTIGRPCRYIPADSEELYEDTDRFQYYRSEEISILSDKDNLPDFCYS